MEACTSRSCKEQHLRSSHIESLMVLRSCSWTIRLHWVVFALAERCPRPRDEVGMTSRAVGRSAEVRDSWGPARIVVAIGRGSGSSHASNLTCFLACSRRGQRYVIFTLNLMIVADRNSLTSSPQHPHTRTNSNAPRTRHPKPRNDL